MFYHNDDYTVRMEVIDGSEKYYIKFHGQTTEFECEVSRDVFILYAKVFNKPLERQRNERRRHIVYGDIDGFIKSGKLTLDSEEHETRIAINATIKKCTSIQQRRFALHFTHGYTITEIAKMQKCDVAAVSRSITAVRKKIKKYFLE